MTTSNTPQSSPATKAKRSKRQLDEATRMAKALSHPVRTRILARLNETVASPNELAQELGEPLGNVSYHVRALHELDCIELVKTEPRRGAVEHYYRAVRRAWGDEAVWELLPPVARRGFAVEWFKESFQDARAAIDDGGFEDRADCNLYFTRLNLDEPAWRKLSKRIDSVLDYALELQAESAARMGEDRSDEEIRTRLILAQYERKTRDDNGKPS